MERMPSIFNDVLSPVTPGPSSSNTCGPYRIARLARALLGEPPRRITVRMARRGGYYDTFYSMHSHEAILAALLGQRPRPPATAWSPCFSTSERRSCGPHL